MPRNHTSEIARPDPALVFGDFFDLVSQPYAQPTIAPLLDKWFGYSIAGSHCSTEVRGATGEHVDLKALHAAIQSDAAYRAALRDAAARLKK